MPFKQDYKNCNQQLPHIVQLIKILKRPDMNHLVNLSCQSDLTIFHIPYPWSPRQFYLIRDRYIPPKGPRNLFIARA